MSNERWISVKDGQRAFLDLAYEAPYEFAMTTKAVGHAYDAAEGQRVETIRWCETHEHGGVDTRDSCFVGRARNKRRFCRTVEAMLILPPKEQA